jgi:isoamylase
VSWDASSYIKDPKDATPAEMQAAQQGNWFENNVLNPAINGSGLIQVYNTFSPKDIELRPAAPAALGSPEWMVQTLSGAAGAIVPYVVAGKVAGRGMCGTAERLGMTGTSAKFMTNAGAANVVGAGAYDFLKNPLEGETRLGNAAAGMSGFATFELGNQFLGKYTHAMSNPVARALAVGGGRAVVGGVGGLAAYETSHAVSSALGEKTETNMAHRLEAMAGGAFLNVSLPVVTKGVTRTVDYAYNRSYGSGVPVARWMQYEGIRDPELLATAREYNPNARVKLATDGVAKADVQSNVIYVPKHADAGLVAHELRHLRIAREVEPHYRAAQEARTTDPTRAQNQYYNVRHYAEFQARLQEAIFNTKKSPDAVTAVIDSAADIPNQLAGNGRTYRQNWAAEWREMETNARSRPQFEYSPADNTTSGGTPRDAKVTMSDSTALTPRDIIVTPKAEVGTPGPLGATVADNGINFAVRSQGAEKMQLLLFDDALTANTKSMRTLDLNRTGDVWHRFVPGVGEGQTYLYRAFGEYNPAVNGTRFNGNMGLIDPYAKAITGDSTRRPAYANDNPMDPDRHLRRGETDQVEGMSKAVAVRDEFDWTGDKHLKTAMEDTIIYEMNVKGFTGGIEELGSIRGTYRGLVEKIPHLKRLGITAVELMPVFQYEKVDNFNGTMGEVPTNPVTGKPLRNQWGYQTIGYMAPEASYSSSGVRGQQVAEFKNMVRELHKNNIEVILDVVYNHTAEDGHLGPTISFRGLDNRVYYMLAPEAPAKYLDHTGCRNTLNVNDPAVRQLILDTLRYWKREMHVDGFRFDLATVFKYDVDNVDKPTTPIVREIETDPILKDAKLIAEPWSIDQYQVGRFADSRWAEWNGVYRDTVRRFLKSDAGQLADLAERITGSRKWYDAQKGRHSINFVTAHDGFTLWDLFSYNQKHNWANGEHNRDGANDNYSWNHGVEGPASKHPIPEAQQHAIEALRVRQHKNAIAMLMLSQGTPMLLSGDEFRRTTNGNNNYWNQEDLNMLDWAMAEKNADAVRFTEEMIKLRKEFGIGWRMPEDVTWHGTKPHDQKFDPDGRYIGWELPGRDGGKRLYSGFNAYWEGLEIELPAGRWRRRVDTNLPNGQEIVGAGDGPIIEGGRYWVQPRTGVVFESVD